MTNSKSKSQKYGKTRYKPNIKLPKISYDGPTFSEYDNYLKAVGTNIRESARKSCSLPCGNTKDFEHFVVDTKPIAFTVDGGSITLGTGVYTYALEIAKEEVKHLYNTDIKFFGNAEISSMKPFFDKLHKTVFDQRSFRLAIRNWLIGVEIEHIDKIATLCNVIGIEEPNCTNEDLLTIGEIQERTAKKIPALLEKVNDMKKTKMSNLGDFILYSSPDLPKDEQIKMTAYSLDGTKFLPYADISIILRVHKLLNLAIKEGFKVDFKQDMMNDAIVEVHNGCGMEYTQDELDHWVVDVASHTLFQFADMHATINKLMK
jgi:hypothetical protein